MKEILAHLTRGDLTVRGIGVCHFALVCARSCLHNSLEISETRANRALGHGVEDALSAATPERARQQKLTRLEAEYIATAKKCHRLRSSMIGLVCHGSGTTTARYIIVWNRSLRRISLVDQAGTMSSIKDNSLHRLLVEFLTRR